MSRVSNPFRYMYRQRYPSIGTIYKAWFGKKYLIWKAKALQQSVDSMAKEIDQRLRLGLKVSDPFEKVVQHILRGRVTIFEVEAIIQSDNPAELLITEYNLLKAGIEDPQCLNTVSFPSIPQWMPESARVEFQDYVAKQAAAKKQAGKKPAGKKKGKTVAAGKQARKSSKNAPALKKKNPFTKKTSNGTGKSKNRKVRSAR